jgi:hypothetical protein
LKLNAVHCHDLIPPHWRYCTYEQHTPNDRGRPAWLIIIANQVF